MFCQRGVVFSVCLYNFVQLILLDFDFAKIDITLPSIKFGFRSGSQQVIAQMLHVPLTNPTHTSPTSKVTLTLELFHICERQVSTKFSVVLLSPDIQPVKHNFWRMVIDKTSCITYIL